MQSLGGSRRCPLQRLGKRGHRDAWSSVLWGRRWSAARNRRGCSYGLPARRVQATRRAGATLTKEIVSEVSTVRSAWETLSVAGEGGRSKVEGLKPWCAGLALVGGGGGAVAVSLGASTVSSEHRCDWLTPFLRQQPRVLASTTSTYRRALRHRLPPLIWRGR